MSTIFESRFRCKLTAMNVSGVYDSYLESLRIGMQSEEANRYVVKALRHIIQDVFAQLSATLVITIAARDWATAQWFDFVLGEVGSAWTAVSVQLLHANDSTHVHGRKYCNLLLLDSYEALLSTNITDDNAGYDDYEYYFIFLQTRDAYVQQELQLILDHCLRHYWLHCNVMIQTAQVEVLVYSYYPYTSQHCQSARPELVNRFDGERMINAPMFPKKLRQMHQCPLTLLLWHMPPFVELRWDAQRSELRATGFEIQLVEHLAQHMNFSLALKNITLLPVENYKLSFNNGTLDGPMEILIQQRANLSVGFFRKTARRNHMLTSPKTHYYVPLVATLDSIHFRFGRMKLLAFPFQSCVWVILLAALLLHGSLYIWRWQGLGLQAVEILLGATVARLPRCWQQRLIYAHWLYGSIPLRIVYQSLLFHFIRAHLFDTIPSSFEQLLARNFGALCTSSLLQMLQEMPQVANSLHRFSVVDAISDQDILDALQQSEGQRVFTITGMDVTSAYLRATNRHERYLTLKQHINVQQVAIYMPKHSYFCAPFNILIRQLDASGFIDFWRRSAFEKYSRCGKRGPKPHSKNEIRPKHRHIHNAQLGGIFRLMGGIYALSCLVLVAELLIHRFYKPGN